MPYYTGDNVPLKFTCADNGTPVTPTSAKVTILKPDYSIVAEVDAIISTNTVSYLVSTTVTDKAGHYKAYFNLVLLTQERTHIQYFEVVSNPA